MIKKEINKNKSSLKYVNDVKNLLKLKNTLEIEEKIVKKKLRKINNEIKSLNNWLIQQ